MRVLARRTRALGGPRASRMVVAAETEGVVRARGGGVVVVEEAAVMQASCVRAA